MKVSPIILCGGSGTRLWANTKYNYPKQFIDFGGWTLLEKTLNRIKDPIFDYPIISTNLKYLKQVKTKLKNSKIKKYKIIVEPEKKNTAPAILTSTLLNDIPNDQPLIFLAADHLIENINLFNSKIKSNIKNLSNENIFIFGVKPNLPSSEYGYFISKKRKDNINEVIKFIEKPNYKKAQQIINKNAYWNSGMFFATKQSIINNFKKYQPEIYLNCLKAFSNGKVKNNIYYLNKKNFKNVLSKSFDYGILEKTKKINAIKLNMSWSDLGSWPEVLKMFKKNKNKYLSKKNIFYRPWGKYINLFKGRNFLIKELTINSKSSISLQKHFYRSEYWLITQGKPIITLNKKKIFKKVNDSIFIPMGSIHRIENIHKTPVKIFEAQTGSVLKESDIVRYKDLYKRV